MIKCVCTEFIPVLLWKLCAFSASRRLVKEKNTISVKQCHSASLRQLCYKADWFKANGLQEESDSRTPGKTHRSQNQDTFIVLTTIDYVQEKHEDPRSVVVVHPDRLTSTKRNSLFRQK